MTVPFIYNFRIRYDLLKFNFLHFIPQARLFFVGKTKPKIFEFKRYQKKISLS